MDILKLIVAVSAASIAATFAADKLTPEIVKRLPEKQRAGVLPRGINLGVTVSSGLIVFGIVRAVF